MSSHTISQKAILYLETYIDVAIDPGPGAPDLPFALVHVVNAQNKVLFSYGNAPDKRPTSSSMVIVQSLTKIVGAMAYMQLVEKGLATLDDPAIIDTWLPELAAK